MNPDQKHQFFQAGFKAGKTHRTSSPETLKLMQVLEIKIQNMENEVKEVKECIKSLPTRDEMKLVVREAIDEAIVACDRRYANKETEKRVDKIENKFWGVAIVITTAFLGLIVFALQGHIKF